MESQWDPEEDPPTLPRRGEPIPPPWFGRDEVPDLDDGEPPPTEKNSRPLTFGMVALMLLIIYIPAEFVIEYRAREDMFARTDMTLGFVWAVVIEGLAIWGLIRTLGRR